MIKIISWNIHNRQSLWNDVAALNADVALLQEAPTPPENFNLNVDRNTPWKTVGEGMNRAWRTAVVGLSDQVALNLHPTKSIEEAESGQLAVSRLGTVAAGEITTAAGELITVASVYSVWERPVKETKSSWIYADASAHRLISDLSAFIGREAGHKVIVAGDWNILYGYGEKGSRYWKQRYGTVFSRMEAIGLKFVGPQFSDGGIRADPHPIELPADSNNVPTYRTCLQLF